MAYQHLPIILLLHTCDLNMMEDQMLMVFVGFFFLTIPWIAWSFQQNAENGWTWWTVSSLLLLFSSSSADWKTLCQRTWMKNEDTDCAGTSNMHCHVSVVEVLFLFTFDLFLLCSPDVVTSDLHISSCLARCAALVVSFLLILGGFQLSVTYRYKHPCAPWDVWYLPDCVYSPNPRAATSGRLCWSEKTRVLTVNRKRLDHEEMDSEQQIFQLLATRAYCLGWRCDVSVVFFAMVRPSGGKCWVSMCWFLEPVDVGKGFYHRTPCLKLKPATCSVLK